MCRYMTSFCESPMYVGIPYSLATPYSSIHTVITIKRYLATCISPVQFTYVYHCYCLSILHSNIICFSVSKQIAK